MDDLRSFAHAAELMHRRLIVKVNLPLSASPPRDAMMITGAGSYIVGYRNFSFRVDSVSDLAGHEIRNADNRLDGDGARITAQNRFHVCAIGIMTFSYGRETFTAIALGIKRDIERRERGGRCRRMGLNGIRCQGGGAECERCAQCTCHGD